MNPADMIKIDQLLGQTMHPLIDTFNWFNWFNWFNLPVQTIQ